MTKEEGSRKAVVSQFFAKPSSASTSNGSTVTSSTSNGALKERNSGLRAQASIISLSSSDDLFDDDDDEIEVIDTTAVPHPPSSGKKRKASLVGESSTSKNASVSNKVAVNTTSEQSKKIKVAPLFERVKNAGTTSTLNVKKEEDTGTARKLQQWKFAPGESGNTSHTDTSSPAPEKTVNGSSTNTRNEQSSSPLPQLPQASQAVEAHRAQVRKMLLGINTEWRKPPDDEADTSAAQTEEGDGDMEEYPMGEEEPVASTSKLSTTKKGKSKKQDKDSVNDVDLSKFASASDVSSKGRKTKVTGDKKGKAKAVEPAVKYTPLEQQVLDIKEKYVRQLHIQ